MLSASVLFAAYTRTNHQSVNHVTVSNGSVSSNPVLFGVYQGDGSGSLSDFETLIGKKINLYGDFEGWDASFPSTLSSTVGSQGKILVIFWEPNFGYNQIVNGSKDAYISQFATGAKAYGYPIILVPFDEMNLNENTWGYGTNGNSAENFKEAWIHVHNLFVNVANVKFAIDFNNVSVPDISGNQTSDYYPGSAYVDYVGIDGFNFGNPWETPAQIFDSAITNAQGFGKPIYILSTASVPGSEKATWITSLGSEINKYPSIAGWVWFNQNGTDGNWLVNSDSASLSAFKEILP